MCDPDIEAEFFLFDRVVNVRLGTGVPIGTRGTIVGIMLGRTNLDTYYEVLFDNLQSNSLDAILLGKNQQRCRIKVHSYHLLNYSHSVRVRSINYQQRRSIPSDNVWEQTSRSQQQQQSSRNSKKESDDNNTATKPKSAPPMTTHDRPYFVKDKEQKSITNNPPTQPLISVENPSLLPQFVENVPNPQITSTPMNMTIPTETFLPSFPSNPTPDALFFRAIQDSGQIQSSHSSRFDQQGWEATLSQDFQNPCMSLIFFLAIIFFYFRTTTFSVHAITISTTATASFFST
jgi:hypothetical protein